MATVTIYGDAADGQIESSNAVYATARSGGTLTVDATSTSVGQRTDGATFWIDEAFLAFDTSLLSGPSSAILRLVLALDASGVDFVCEARTYDWGTSLTTADYVAGASLSGLTLLASINSSGIGAVGSKDFTNSGTALVDSLNLTGFTRLLLDSDRTVSNTAPTSSFSEYLLWRPTEFAGTTSDPQLVVTDTDPPPSGDDVLNPARDYAINSWTTDTGAATSLYAAIDEGTASDTDYIQSPAGPTSAQYYETALETHADPASSTGHVVHYRYQKNISSGAIDLQVDLMQAATSKKTWTHTGIPNTWTQQDQTLSGAEADSITDYSDLRLRFTPDMVTTDQTVPVPTFVASRATANSNTAATTVDLVLTGLTVGNYLIVRSAADNPGGGGAAVSFTPSNFSGTAMGTHTEYQQNNDPGAASAGTTCNVSVIKIAATSGTIRLTYGGSVIQSCAAEEWSGIHATTPVVGTPVKANGTASTNFVAGTALTDASVALGNVAYAAISVEGPTSDTYTQDADTTNGSWVTLTKLGTSIATADLNQTTYGGYKTVTAAGAQTYNPTGSVARDSAGIILELAAAPTPAPTIKAQVSWANFELPSSGVARSFGGNVGAFFPTSGAVAFGAGAS